MSTTPPKCYLIPTPIVEDKWAYAKLSGEGLVPVLARVECFLVEHTASALAFCRKQYPSFDPSSKTWVSIHKQEKEACASLRTWYQQHKDVLLMSDAGCPCVADPGDHIVMEAHRLGFEIVPWIGTSAILLALMSSGLNGQQFSFHGYLPIHRQERKTQLQSLERHPKQRGYTHIFIETPYRNQQFFEACLEALSPCTQLCIAKALLSTHQSILTKDILSWRSSALKLPKENVIFLFNAEEKF